MIVFVIRQIFVAGLLITFIASLQGCFAMVALMAEDKTNVTEQKKYWGAYEPGQIYRLKDNVFLVDYGWHFQNFLVPTNGSGRSVPKSEDQYHATPDAWPKIEQVVPRMTRLRVDSFVWHETLNVDRARVYAEVLSGTLRGKSVEISSLSEWTDYPYAMKPDSKYLERINQSAEAVD